MILFKHQWISILLLLITNIGYGQNQIIIKGQFVDKGSLEPIAFATVEVVDKGVGTATDSLGKLTSLSSIQK